MAFEVVRIEDILAGQTASVPCVAALGTFDGVHRGHVEILNTAKQMAAASGVQSAVFTFDRQPQELFNPETSPALITSVSARMQLLAQYVDRVIVTSFQQELANLEPVDFIEKVLVQGLGCTGVAAGFNYTFGKSAHGHAVDLTQLGTRYGLNVSIIPPVFWNGQQVSSTIIRKLVSEGNVVAAEGLLGRPYSLDGKVVSGDARGRELGYPTANLASESRLLIPGDGVYATEFWLRNQTQVGVCLGRSVTAVSDRPTFAGTDRSVESFILDYHGDLYGAEVSIRFLKRLRDIKKFTDAQALQTQIHADVMAARQQIASSRLQP